MSCTIISLRLQNTSRFWPGLGGSDTDYAWVLVCSPITELAVVPFAALMAHRSPFSVTIFFSFILMAVGGVIYAIAVNVWMIFIGRALFGAAGGICIPTIHTYIGEMGIVMDNLRKKQGKKPRKDALYIAFSFMMNGGFFVAFGEWQRISVCTCMQLVLEFVKYISQCHCLRLNNFRVPIALTSTMAQFENVNPYRWPGWFIAVLSFATLAATLIVFTETRSFTCTRNSCSKFLAGLKLSAQLKSKSNFQLSVSFFVVFIII